MEAFCAFRSRAGSRTRSAHSPEGGRPPGASIRSLNQRCTLRVAEQHYRSIEMTVHDHCALSYCSFGALIEPTNNELATRPSDIVNPDPGL